MSGWNNHEDSFEETLRREMLKYKQLYELLQEDYKQLTKSYYDAIKRIKELTEQIEDLKRAVAQFCVAVDRYIKDVE